MQLSNAILSLLLTLRSSSAQTAVGCDASCPPIGYEFDSSHLCPGDSVDESTSSRLHDICHPLDFKTGNDKLSFDSFKKRGHVTVIANYYTGCEAGRRESGVFAGIAQRVHDATDGRINFVTSLKGGGNCVDWAEVYQGDALSMGLNGGVRPSTMPLTVEDSSLDLRDRFFTPPYPHPSYIILDENLKVTYKSVGPCCGYVSYYACTDDVALGLDKMLTDKIYEVYDKQMSNLFGVTTTGADPTVATSTTTVAATTILSQQQQPCQSTTYSEWSACSKTCGDGGIQFRFRANSDLPVETQPCPAIVTATLPTCTEQCVAEFGNDFDVSVVASDLASPRDLAFHPTPGVHLGTYSEGRTFHPDGGQELWVANGFNHSVSIIASLGTEHQTTISRLDRGYYHYMNNITALAFNTVKGTSRNADQDTFNYFAVCNDNINDYAGTKEPNYFMGPTLYDSDTVNKPGQKNTVNRIGEDCALNPADECFFLHADMLHESPACIGIAHDPEIETSYGAVYWAFDATGDNSGDGGQLVRFDFSQPHGPGSMDHSIAQVRRYPEVKLYRDDTNGYGHAGMVVHPEKRVLFVANPGKGNVVAVHIDTGKYTRTAREEYPIFSNRLPSFEYSIYECVEQNEIFASGLVNPSGLALSLDGTRLFVAERGGRIVAFEVDSGVILQSIDLSSKGYTSIGGLAVSPETGALYFVDMDTNTVVRINGASRIIDGDQCGYRSRINSNFQPSLSKARSRVDSECGRDTFSLVRDYACEVDGTIPNGTLFEQVHTDTGYASDNPDVQSMAGMDEAAALLANRTDCEYDSELNLDALLLGGYYCHVCLPRNHGSSCDGGGTCANVQWQGFTCDNEYHIGYGYYDNGDDEASLVISSLHFGRSYPASSLLFDQIYPRDVKLDLSRGITYRFTVGTGEDQPVAIRAVPEFSWEDTSLVESSVKNVVFGSGGVTNGPILLTVDDTTPDCLYLTSPGTQPIILAVEGVAECPSIVPIDYDGSFETAVPSDSGGDTGTSDFDLLPPRESSAGNISSLFCGWRVTIFVVYLTLILF